MNAKKLPRRILSGMCSAAAVCAVLPQLRGIHAQAAENITWSALTSNENVPGMYCYTVSGNVTNPCGTGAYNEKKDIIHELWFDFSVKTNNGTGSLHTYRADFSYNSSTGQNNNGSLVQRCFVRDSTGPFSFDIWLPGQLTNVDFHLDLDGWLGWFDYERLSFEINSITCGGVQVNTNPSSGNVSSSTYDSNDRVGARMLPIDGESLTVLLGTDHMTLKEYSEMAANGEFTARRIRDSYGGLLEKDTLQRLAALCDGPINQSFAHSDEQSYYYYELDLNVYNPINVNDADSDALNTFYFDFKYRDNNGYGSEQTYRFDMSYQDGKNKNDKFANRFRAVNDTGYDIQLGLWVPGIVSEVKCLLNMDGGERLGLNIQAVKLAGYCVSRDINNVSSSYYDSSCTILCGAPDALIDLDSYSDEETAVLLRKIRFNQRTDLRDQYGSLITDDLWGRANREINDYFDTFTDRATPLQLTRSPQYIARNAMSGTVYHAQLNAAVQDYMAGRKSAAENAADIAKSLMQEQGAPAAMPMGIPDNWSWQTESNAGRIVLSGLPAGAEIYRRMQDSETGTPVYVHLKTSDLERFTMQKAGYSDALLISLPESAVILGAERSPGTVSFDSVPIKVVNETTGRLEDEKYYERDKDGNIVLNKRGKPKIDNSLKPTEFSYQYQLAFPENGAALTYQLSVPMPQGSGQTGKGSLLFRNLPAGTEGYLSITTGGPGSDTVMNYLIHLTKQDLETYAFPQLNSELYICLPEGYAFAGMQNSIQGGTLTISAGSDASMWTFCSIQNGQLSQTEPPAELPIRFSHCFRNYADTGSAEVYTATAKALSSGKKGSQYVISYQAGQRVKLWNGYELLLLSSDAANPPLIMTAADGRYSNSSGESDNTTKLYLFYPDTRQYTVLDENGKPVGFKHIDAAEYTALGVDSRKYAGYAVSVGTLRKSCTGTTLTVLALDE